MPRGLPQDLASGWRGRVGVLGSREIEAAPPTQFQFLGLGWVEGREHIGQQRVVGVGVGRRTGSDWGRSEGSSGREGLRRAGLAGWSGGCFRGWSQPSPTARGAPGLCSAPPSLALQVPRKTLTRRARPPLKACTWARSTPWLLPPPGRRPSLELAGSHSFLPHFRQAVSRCGPGPSRAGTSQTTPSPNCDVCKWCEPGDSGWK